MTSRLRDTARRLRLEVDALAIARQDPRVPRAARVVIWLTVAYALSPIDLIPDVIPVLGLLDDLLIVPLGLWLALRLVPAEVMDEARERSRTEVADTLDLRQTGFRIMLGLWLAVLVGIWLVW